MFAAKSALIACALFAAAAFAGGAQAASYTFNTSDSPFTAGLDNHGWWSPTLPNTNSTNYAAGYTSTSAIRNFFTFDLASLNLSGQRIVSATLEVRRNGYTSPDATETFQLFDVLTAANILNNNVGASATIYDDLGSGNSYGSVVIPQAGVTTQMVSVSLNGTAQADIAAAAGGYFSIGGSCITCSSPGQNIFSTGSNTGDQRLVIQTAPIPEPSTYAMLGIGLAALAFLRRRKVV
jgi:hypothetical protein